MNISRGMLLAFALVAAACGDKQSVASKSAAAYRQAQAKGIPVAGGHEHGGHVAAQTIGNAEHGTHGATATGDPAADHSAHGTAGAPDHAAMGHDTGSANAHEQHGAAPAADAHAAHNPPSGAATHDQHAGMQHAGSPAAVNSHTQHGGANTPAPPVAVQAPRSNAEMQRIQPAATLRGDAFDAPNSLSVAEAAKAAQGGGHAGHGAGPETQMQPAAAALYACPMHPEVKSDRPGTCPKCGMALVYATGGKDQ